MSNVALAWAMRQQVGHQPSKHVLMVIADYADERDSCYPSQEHLALVCEMSVRSVRESVKRLESGGFMQRIAGDGEGSRHNLTRYRLLIPERLKRISTPRRPENDPAAPAGSSDENHPAPAAGSDDATRHDVPDTTRQLTTDYPAAHDKTTRQEVPGIPYRNPSESDTHTARARDPRLDQILDRHPWSDRWDVWEVEDAWAVLSEADRAEAAKHFARWLERLDQKRVAKGTIQGPAHYLAQRLWTLMPDETPAPEQRDWIMVELFSRPWWFLLWRSVESGDLKAAKFTLELAAGGTSTVARGEAKAAIEAGADSDLVRLSVSDDRDSIEAWRKHLFDAHRIRMPVPDVAPYVWAPAKSPDELAQQRLDEEVPL